MTAHAPPWFGRSLWRGNVAQAVRRYREEVGGEPGRLVVSPQTLAIIGSEPIEGLVPEAADECQPGMVYLLPLAEGGLN